MVWHILIYSVAVILAAINLMLLWGAVATAATNRKIRKRAWEVIYLGDGIYNLKPPTGSRDTEGRKVQSSINLQPRQVVKLLAEESCIDLHDGGCLYTDGRFLHGGSPYWLQLYPRDKGELSQAA